MKNITKILFVAASVFGLAACNKAEFKTATYITLNSDRYSAKEDSGILEIPVSIFNGDECTLTYSVEDVSAVNGKDYDVVDRTGKVSTSGVLYVSSDKEKTDCIRIKLYDNPEKTGNLIFNVKILESATEGVNLGGTKTCKVTIIDNQSGLATLIGNWAGEGVDTDGAKATLSFYLDGFDINSDEEVAAVYPKANIVFTDVNMTFANGNVMDAEYPLYGYFDENMSTVNLFGLQPFNAYNFGDPVGVCWVAIAPYPSSLADLKKKHDVVFSADSDNLVLDADAYLWLLGYEDYEPNGYTCGDFASGFTLTKN